jgi:hypothetical protein
MYTRSNRTYPLYRDGSAIGEVRVRRGMWERRDQPLYSLPGCRLTTPLSAVSLETSVRLSFTVEAFAATPGVRVQSRPSAKLTKPLESDAQRIAVDVAGAAGIDSASLTPNAFHAVAINTGATKSPTLISSYLDPEASDRNGTTSHVVAIADDISGRYQATFQHVASGPVATAEYRRYIDHLDVNGDGVDEIMLEGWHFAGETFLSILGYASGEWREVYRGRSSWCLARPKVASR